MLDKAPHYPTQGRVATVVYSVAHAMSSMGYCVQFLTGWDTPDAQVGLQLAIRLLYHL